MAEKATASGSASTELDAKIETWRKEHGEVAVFRTRYGVIVARPAEQEAFERFFDKAGNDKLSTAAALRELAFASVLYPEHDKAVAIIQRLPALAGKIGNAVVAMGGSDIEGEILKV